MYNINWLLDYDESASMFSILATKFSNAFNLICVDIKKQKQTVWGWQLSSHYQELPLSSS